MGTRAIRVVTALLRHQQPPLRRLPPTPVLELDPSGASARTCASSSGASRPAMQLIRLRIRRQLAEHERQRLPHLTPRDRPLLHEADRVPAAVAPVDVVARRLEDRAAAHSGQRIRQRVRVLRCPDLGAQRDRSREPRLLRRARSRHSPASPTALRSAAPSARRPRCSAARRPPRTVRRGSPPAAVRPRGPPPGRRRLRGRPGPRTAPASRHRSPQPPPRIVPAPARRPPTGPRPSATSAARVALRHLLAHVGHVHARDLPHSREQRGRPLRLVGVGTWTFSVAASPTTSTESPSASSPAVKRLGSEPGSSHGGEVSCSSGR